jgi:DNA repair protein SbcD/Mre11
LKLLHFADLHLDTAFAWAPPVVASKRRQAIRECLRAICRLAQEREVDVLTCGGDLYEQDRFTADTAEFVVQTFASVHPMPVLLVPGNHDWLAPASIYATGRWSPNVHIFSNDRLEAHELAGATIWGAAHRAPANTDDFLHDFHASADGLNIGLFHASERSGLPLQPAGKEPHAAFSAYEIRAAGLDHALLGHYHTPFDGPDYTYPGNPEPLSFGEDRTRGAVLFEFVPGAAYARERIRVAQTSMDEIEIDVSGSVSQQDVVDRVAAAAAGRTGLLRMSLHGEVSTSLSLDMAVLAHAAKGPDYVDFETSGIRPAYDLDAIKAEKTVRGQFVRDVLQATLEGDERQRVLVTGLRALAGRRDLEAG